MKKNNTYYGTGKRKGAIAKVTLTNGTGKITVNGKDVHEYLPFETLVMDLSQPLEITNTKEIFDVDAKVVGGGFRGQAGAIRLGIARALVEANPEFKSVLKKNKMLTRDSRSKERKKFGKYGARRSPQFTKR